MASEGRNIVTQGRVVWLAAKDIFSGAQRKDATGRLLTNDKGEPSMQYGFGLAVPKPVQGSSPETVKNFTDIWEAMHLEAASLYQSGQIPPGFSMKYKDGDGVDHNGQQFNTREGYAGCLVFALTTTLPLKFFKYEGGAYVQINDGIKCGDYVQVQIGIKGHLPKPGTQGKPGLYLNPGLTLFLAAGKEIVNAPNVDAVFGSQAPKAVFEIPAYQAPQSFAGMAQAQQAPAAPAWGGQPNQAVLPPQFQAPPMAPPVHNYAPQAPAAPQNFGVPPMGNGFAAPMPSFGQPPQYGNPVNTQVAPSVPSNGFPFPGQR